MNKYKIMLIDDKLKDRWENLSAFFTNSILERCKKIKDIERKEYGKKLVIEFEIIAPKVSELLDEFIEKNKVDAYLLDVLYEENGWESCSLQNILSHIRVHNAKAPIFVYSSDWNDKAILQEVSSAFRNGFPGKMASYYYDLKDINMCVMDFINSGTEENLDRLLHERSFIREVIARHQGRTTKLPKSQNGNVTILHISDIQYGDKETTRYTADLWKEIVRVCKEMQMKNRIAGVDLLAITGDVCMHGVRSEMEEAERDLKTLFKDLWEDEVKDKSYRERILLVPGNHDFDLNYCVMDYLGAENKDKCREVDFEKIIDNLKAKKQGGNSSYLREGFSEFKKFAHRITGSDVFFDSEHLNYVEKCFEDWNLRFICLNTADGITAIKTNGVKVDEEDYRDRIIRGEDWNNGIFTVVLSHHTPIYISEMTGEEKLKFTTVCNSIIRTCGAGLWLGGHRHLHGRQENGNNKNSCAICESATVRLEEQWVGKEEFMVNTKDGPINSHRGFQIINLIKKENGFEPQVIKFVFNEFGEASEVQQ